MKDKTVMRADLRTDLKDSGALWSDAELNRCIERATSDLSRFLPRERIYEAVLEFDVSSESVTFPKDTDADYVVDAQTFNGKTAGSTFTIAASPDVPRILTVLVTDDDNSMTDWHVRISGVDEEDAGVTEDFYFGNGKSQTGKQVFKTVHKVQLVEDFGGSAAAGDVLDIGIGAYTDTWVYLDYKPVKYQSESATDDASNSLARNTDYEIDYGRGRVKAIASANISAEEVCSFTYKKNLNHLDLTSLDDFIRVFRVEYPVGRTPQNFCDYDLYGKYLIVTGSGELESQPEMSEGSHVRVYYDATHHPPTDYTPGTVPEFLENTVLMAAAAYALYIYSLKHEHQALTDMTTARTAIAAADTLQGSIAAQFTALEGYVSTADTTLDGCDALYAAIVTALDAANAYLDLVATDLSNADGVKDSYIGTTNYVDGGSEPDIKTYLESGDALLNTVTKGGENERTPEMYAAFAAAVGNSLVAAFEQHRSFYLQDANAHTNSALAFAQEAAQRTSEIRAKIEQASGYNSLASSIARDVEDRLSQIAARLEEASSSMTAATNDLVMADRFRDEANARRDEVWSIWRDRKEYIGDFGASKLRQVPTGG